MFAPYLLIEGGSRLSLLQAGAALVICGVAFAAFYWSEPRQDGIYPAAGTRWLRQAGIVLLSTFLSAVFCQLGQFGHFENANRLFQ
jgi:hypothetical protein